ncbi:hypothetical protein AB0L40_11015 [Patulibacter sp. NPDC049589]|uniref:hypothetical protein n=1 Tax=Patulibacter sp. NPDC049589 TaxID=3154731 RepID=UPI0034469CF8
MGKGHDIGDALEMLRRLAPPPNGWRRLPAWEMIEGGGRWPHALRALVETYDAARLDVPDPDDDVVSLVGVSLRSPVDEDEDRALVSSAPWDAFDATWTLRGVSRPTDGPGTLSDLAASVVGRTLISWASVDGVGSTTTGALYVSADEGARDTVVVLSRLRPEYWLLELSPADVVLRTLLGATDCPWLDGRAREPEPGLIRVSPRYFDDEDPTVDEPEPSRWTWTRSRANDEPLDEPATLPLLALGASAGEAASARADATIDDLRRLAPPPSGPRTDGAWSAVEAQLGGTVPDELRALIDEYGRGTFATDDPDAHAGVHVELCDPAEILRWPGDELLEFADRSDLPGNDVRVIRWASLSPNPGDDELWLWQTADSSGYARRNDDRAAFRVAGTPSGLIVAAIGSSGVFSHLFGAFDASTYPVRFAPGDGA